MLPFIIWLGSINFAIAFSAFSAFQVTEKKLILILICLLSNNGFPTRIVAFFTDSDRRLSIVNGFDGLLNKQEARMLVECDFIPPTVLWQLENLFWIIYLFFTTSSHPSSQYFVILCTSESIAAMRNEPPTANISM